MPNVARILKEKGRVVATAKAGDSLSDVIRALAAKKIGALVIVDDRGAVAGIISERDIVRLLASHPAGVLAEPVARHMTSPVMTCTEASTMDEVMQQMTNNRFRHMPVVEKGQLAGLISLGDVVKQKIADAEFEAHSMRQYIATG
ncbi:MAG: CBS domain-containing protein [Hyphomicrobiales bacterium]|nr:CBS domain-containing protein [Hyphomicrobiales bacterium]